LRIKIIFVIERPGLNNQFFEDNELSLAIKTLEEVKSIFEKNGISVLKTDIEDLREDLN